MRKVKALMTGFVGIDGRSVHVEEGEEFDADHEFVIGRPDVFGEPGPVRAVETVGEIDDVEPGDEDAASDVDVDESEPASGVTTKTAAPIVRRARKPKNG